MYRLLTISDSPVTSEMMCCISILNLYEKDIHMQVCTVSSSCIQEQPTLNASVIQVLYLKKLIQVINKKLVLTSVTVIPSNYQTHFFINIVQVPIEFLSESLQEVVIRLDYQIFGQKLLSLKPKWFKFCKLYFKLAIYIK